MGNIGCSCKKKDEGDELKMDEPLPSKTPAQNESARENGISESESKLEEHFQNSQQVSSRNDNRPLTNSNSHDNLKVEIHEDDKYT
jgi:hypothetical protein